MIVPEERIMSVFVIGPSHIHASILSASDRDRYYGDVKLEAHPGIPVWSSRILEALQEHAALGMRIVWIVSDWKLNNSDYNVIKNDGCPTLFIETLGRKGNVASNYSSPMHIETLAQHAMRCIDRVIEILPEVRLIFWCLYKRTRTTDASSYPIGAQYKSMVSRYAQNVIDIDEFTTPSDFNTRLTVDSGGHPSSAGQAVLSSMILSR